MISLRHIARTLAFAAIAAVPATASAGELGLTSRGSVSITATVPLRLKVTWPTDLLMRRLTPGRSRLICVITNSPGSTFSLTLVGTPIGASAVDQFGASGSVLVEWRDEQNRLITAELQSDTSVRELPTATSCRDGGNDTATLRVNGGNRTEHAMNALRPWTILVAPN